jgi:hypothetical protein
MEAGEWTGKFSPHISQALAEVGRIAPKQTEQTGSREILSKGAPQRRQSEGNSAANKL